MTGANRSTSGVQIASWMSLSVLVFAIELLKAGEPVCLRGELVNGLEGFVSEGFSIKLAANAEELELTQLVIDRQIASMVEMKDGLERACEKVATVTEGSNDSLSFGDAL